MIWRREGTSAILARERSQADAVLAGLMTTSLSLGSGHWSTVSLAPYRLGKEAVGTDAERKLSMRAEMYEDLRSPLRAERLADGAARLARRDRDARICSLRG